MGRLSARHRSLALATQQKSFLCISDFARTGFFLLKGQELWTGRRMAEGEKWLGRTLDIIRANAWKRHERVGEKDKAKSRAWMQIAFLLTPSAHGFHGDFWYAAKLQQSLGTILWRSDGVYLLRSWRSNATHLLNNELEPNYARFVKSCAKLIAKKLR